MGAQANVTSVDALESMRAALIVFSSKALSVVDQLSDEIRRTRMWVQQEQRRHWEAEVKKRDRALVEAKQELLGVKMIGMIHNFSAQQAAVRKCSAAFEEAKTKLLHVKKWTRDFDAAAEPLTRSLENFRGVLARDLPEAAGFLLHAQKTLTAYNETRDLRTAPPVSPPVDDADPIEPE
jgi:hypothetical protein